MARRLGLRSASPPPPPPHGPGRMTPEILEGLRADLMSGRLPLDRVSVSDDVQDGLRALVRKSGLITFHAHYETGEGRPYMKIGHYPEPNELRKNPKAGQEMIELTRKRTATIRALAKKGIDVQEGLHARLLRELDADGDKWRP